MILDYLLLFLWPHRLTVRTLPSQGRNGSSILLGVTFDDVALSDIKIHFFDINGCNAADYTASDNIAGHYIFDAKKGREKNGVLVMGSTHVMTFWGENNREILFNNLKLNKNFGSAYKEWFNAFWKTEYKKLCGPEWFIRYYYGLTILGDPTLKMRPPNRKPPEFINGEFCEMGDDYTCPIMVDGRSYCAVGLEDNCVPDCSYCHEGVDLPTAVELNYFKANPDSQGKILVEWETAMELDTAAFNLYRSESGNESSKTKINSQPAIASGTVEGSYYSFLDSNVAAGKTYYYWLEDIDMGGKGALHGPVSAAVPKAPSPTPTPTAKPTPVPPGGTWLPWGRLF